MTAAKRQGLIMVIVMTTMMGFVMSAWFTHQLVGFGPEFFGAWAERYFSTYMIVLPTVLVVSPIAQWLAGKINTRLDAASLVKSSRNTALQAWQYNAEGHRGEGFDKWLAALSENVSITMPLGQFRGENTGIARARQIYDAIAHASPKLIYEKPLRISESDNTVVIEFDDHGTIAGYPYRNRIAASFDIKDGKVAAYREYFGDIDPAVVAMMNGATASPITLGE
jgi:ketosteroid isomerase-like protein